MRDYFYMFWFDHLLSDFDQFFHHRLSPSRWFVLFSILVKPIGCSRSLTTWIVSIKVWGRSRVEIPFVFYRPPPMKQIGVLDVAENSNSVKPQGH